MFLQKKMLPPDPLIIFNQEHSIDLVDLDFMLPHSLTCVLSFFLCRGHLK